MRVRRASVRKGFDGTLAGIVRVDPRGLGGGGAPHRRCSDENCRKRELPCCDGGAVEKAMPRHLDLHGHKAGDTGSNNDKVERLRCNPSDPYSRSPGPRSDVHWRPSSPSPLGPEMRTPLPQLLVEVATRFAPCHLLGTPNTRCPTARKRRTIPSRRVRWACTDHIMTVVTRQKKISTGDREGSRSPEPFLAGRGVPMMKPAVFRRRGVCWPIASCRAHAGPKISVATWNGYIGDACALPGSVLFPNWPPSDGLKCSDRCLALWNYGPKVGESYMCHRLAGFARAVPSAILSDNTCNLKRLAWGSSPKPASNVGPVSGDGVLEAFPRPSNPEIKKPKRDPARWSVGSTRERRRECMFRAGGMKEWGLKEDSLSGWNVGCQPLVRL